MTQADTDTIVAVATPPGQGAISIIRLSGPRALACLRSLFSNHSLPSREQTFGRILDPSSGKVLDEVLATFFPGPRSYTGEDVVEVSGHGGPFVTGQLFRAFLQAGARAAEGGEFTQRAFLNGKLDLTQAEAVMDLISAESDLARQSALDQLGGSLGSKVEDLRQQLIKILAHLEAFIDFPDEDIDPETGNALSARIQSLAEETSLLAATATAGRILREGVRTVICGAPNAGKSSLLNTLTGQDRAIVTEIPGTTRDTIEESIQLGGILLRLTDTAGIRDTDDVVEQAGIERSNRALSQAELVLEVLDGTQPPPESPPIPEGAIHLRLRNKADLPMNPSWNDASLSEFHPISCTTGEGLSALREQAQELLLQRKASSDLALVINARHQVALENTSKFLNTGREGLQRGVAPEFIAVDLRSALESLGEITGKTDIEEILGEIFQTFCIGK